MNLPMRVTQWTLFVCDMHKFMVHFLKLKMASNSSIFRLQKLGSGGLQTHSKKVGLTHSELVGFGLGFGDILEWVYVVGLLWGSYENFRVPLPTIKTHSF